MNMNRKSADDASRRQSNRGAAPWRDSRTQRRSGAVPDSVLDGTENFVRMPQNPRFNRPASSGARPVNARPALDNSGPPRAERTPGGGNLDMKSYAMAYTRFQDFDDLIEFPEALDIGTIFSALNLPFLGYPGAKGARS